eukprot:2920702-Rhodomonas_salina.7
MCAASQNRAPRAPDTGRAPHLPHVHRQRVAGRRELLAAPYSRSVRGVAKRARRQIAEPTRSTELTSPVVLPWNVALTLQGRYLDQAQRPGGERVSGDIQRLIDREVLERVEGPDLEYLCRTSLAAAAQPVSVAGIAQTTCVTQGVSGIAQRARRQMLHRGTADPGIASQTRMQIEPPLFASVPGIA